MSDDNEILFPDPQHPAFTVRRGRGDYNRAGAAGVETPAGGDPIYWDRVAAVLRYAIIIPDQIPEMLFFSKPIGYDRIQIWWGTPGEGTPPTWTEACVVRSGFGHPTTLADGEVIHVFQNPGKAHMDQVPGIVLDGSDVMPLPAGRWFYYTLIFHYGNQWIPVAKTHTLIPVDYHHKDHLLNLMPPFYLQREAEDAYSYIDRWMTMIGYDLDYTRTLAEGVQNIYDPDSSQVHLLEAMGQQNLGFIKPSAMGDIRYRSVLANNRNILFKRGTIDGLRTYMESVFKSQVTVTNGLNELLLVDDAEFKGGVGDWSPMSWRIGYELAMGPFGVNNTTVLPVDTFPTRNVKIEAFPPHSELLNADIWNDLPQEIGSVSGVARLQATNGEHLAIACGSGQQSVIVGVDSKGLSVTYDEQHLDPFFRGVPVDPTIETTYYLSFWARRDPGNTAESDRVIYGFAQFDREPGTQGFSDGFRAVNESAPKPADTAGGFDGWQARVPWSDDPVNPWYSIDPEMYFQSFLTGPGVVGPMTARTFGNRFYSDVNGFVTRLRYYKESGSPGPHSVTLWKASDGSKLGEVTFTGEVTADSGWKEMALATPVPIVAGTHYILSVFYPNGTYSFGEWPTVPTVYANGLTTYQQVPVDIGPVHFPRHDPAFPQGTTAVAAVPTFPNTFDGTGPAAESGPDGEDWYTYYLYPVNMVFTTQLPTLPSVKPSLLVTRSTTQTGGSSDEWKHHVFAQAITKDTRYIVPFIWFQRTPPAEFMLGAPITTPRYLTGVLVNKTQSTGVAQVFQPDEYLKLLNQATPTKHIIGAPEGFDDEDRTDNLPTPGPPYKVIGEQRT